MEDINELIEVAKDFIVVYGLKLVGAIVALIVGLWIIKLIVKSISKRLSKSIKDPSLSGFLISFLSIALKILLIISIMSMIGIPMTSFIAILAAAGLAVGLALSGTLQNFAGGIMVLMFKPYVVGDVITALGHTGKVADIQIFNTILKTPDNRTIIVPNGKIYSESIVNFSKEAQRRVDFTFGIGYDNDLEKAKSILNEIINSHKLILKNPESFVGLIELGDSSVNIVVRAWVEAVNYWTVFFEINETVFKEFNAKGINIPYPQMDVHIKNQK
ncbi:MAG: mechanosensitive ion channel [Prolixibacteraceae bacterium]|jgi:small conductance mechanosensitive channel|nr:mechanosensitive ion channel [Prolixibacteraceae bacterium]